MSAMETVVFRDDFTMYVRAKPTGHRCDDASWASCKWCRRVVYPKQCHCRDAEWRADDTVWCPRCGEQGSIRPVAVDARPPLQIGQPTNKPSARIAVVSG